jgi:hypothetical protein
MNDLDETVVVQNKAIIEPVDEPLPRLQVTKIVFDWDDTFMPTSWLEKIKHSPDQEGLQELADLSKIVISVITQAKLYGLVMIVTNADEGWVHESCSRHMPNLKPHLAGIPIISAQERYSLLYSDPCLWKIAAFRDELLPDLLPYTTLNVISIGDGVPEFTAVNFLKNLISPLLNINLITKGIKLLEKPDPNMLIYELEIVYRDMKDIIKLQENMNQLMRVGGTAE